MHIQTGVARIMVDFQIQQRLSAPRRPLLALGNVNVSAAALAAMVAGSLALIVMLMLSTSLYDESTWKLPRMVAAVLAGPGVLEPDDEFSFTLVGLGIVVHFALALLYSFVLATLVKDMPEAAAPWIGMAFGVGLYFGNLYGFTQLFPWFAQLRTLDTLAAHVLFGIVAASAYRHLAASQDR
jgi:hypothetical protein